MKKNLLLVPNLIILSAIPFICLSGCKSGEDKPKPEPPIPPAPTEYDFILNESQSSPAGITSEIKTISTKPNTFYTFWIDMTKWPSTPWANGYSKMSLSLNTQPDKDYLTTQNLQIWIDGKSFDTSKCYIDSHVSYRNEIGFDSSDFQKLLSARVITGRVQTSNKHYERSEDTSFSIYGE